MVKIIIGDQVKEIFVLKTHRALAGVAQWTEC